MRDSHLFGLALGLSDPWYVARCEFDRGRSQLDIHIDFKKGARLACPECGCGACAIHDTESKRWRHLNFFEHQTFLHARTPRVKCERCGVKTVEVPWARKGSGFTLLFEAFVMCLAKEMPINAIGGIVFEWDTRLWRIVHHYVDQARANEDFSQVKSVGVDETSSRRGHNYISVFVDLERSKALYATEGKGAETVERFAEDLAAHGGKAENIKEVCCDMSPAYLKGVGEFLKQAEMTFDKFHVMKIINEAVDKVRRAEQKERPELKGSRYVWLKNPENLTKKQEVVLEVLDVAKLNLKTARAYRMKLAFQDFYHQPAEEAEGFLRQWLAWASRSRLWPMIKAGRTIRDHFDGVMRWFVSRVTNGVLEGINSLIQAAKAKARGYRTTRNLITAVYLVAGKLEQNWTYP